jgi:hypothetical protein
MVPFWELLPIRNLRIKYSEVHHEFIRQSFIVFNLFKIIF